MFMESIDWACATYRKMLRKEFRNATKIPRRRSTGCEYQHFSGRLMYPIRARWHFCKTPARNIHGISFWQDANEEERLPPRIENSRSKTMTDANEVARFSLGVPRARGRTIFLRYLYIQGSFSLSLSHKRFFISLRWYIESS